MFGDKVGNVNHLSVERNEIVSRLGMCCQLLHGDLPLASEEMYHSAKLWLKEEATKAWLKYGYSMLFIISCKTLQFTSSTQMSCLLSTGMWLCHRDRAFAACSRHSRSSLQSFCKSPNLPMSQRSCPGSQEMVHHSCTRTSHGEGSGSQTLLPAHPCPNGLLLGRYLHGTWCTRSGADELKWTKAAGLHMNSRRNAPLGACSVHSMDPGCRTYDAANAHVGRETHQCHRWVVRFRGPTKDAYHDEHLRWWNYCKWAANNISHCLGDLRIWEVWRRLICLNHMYEAMCHWQNSSIRDVLEKCGVRQGPTYLHLSAPQAQQGDNRSESPASMRQTTSKRGCTLDIQRSWHRSGGPLWPRGW